jgi:ADP-ribose pyrophosphatase YjhB (NUDIX family)
MPGVWSTHMGGHVGEGETYESNALKELHEESGIAVHPTRLLPWRTTRIDGPRLWAREFVTLLDRDASALLPQPGEVDAFRWMSLKEVLHMSKKEPSKWCAGTHDFRVEYQCMRSALSVADALGALPVPRGFHLWQPGLASSAMPIA